METNELKKGDRVVLANGWKATIEDNRKGNTRLATVYGIFTEMGSVYSHDILYKVDMTTGQTTPIDHTPQQNKCKTMNNLLFG
tara:strand:+ start:399 stop:647 length:249 start_codon:yes stop_codon:yes gene_type:complete